MASFTEKVGYGLGDMSSSMFWKIFMAYLPFFYSNIYGLSLEATALLVIVARIWDAVSDPMMGILADRTQTRWGKYRPYLLWISAPFAIAGVLLFTIPSGDETTKLIWAYATYLLMMTVYTAINVPYGSMLAVMTDDSDEKTTFSSYRMLFAYAGSFVVLFAWEPLCRYFNGLQGLAPEVLSAQSWQYGMIVVSAMCFVLFVFTFAMTRERLRPISTGSIVGDLRSLLCNGPWWLLLGGIMSFNFLNAIRYTVIPFFFTSVVAADARISLFSFEMLFYAGLFFSVGEVANMVGVAVAAPIARGLGKKGTFLFGLIGLALSSAVFYFVPLDAYLLMLLLQVVFCVITGIMSPLVWSMYADVSDYAELELHTASTGLIFSSSSMAQKFGNSLGAGSVMMMLVFVGYSTTPGAVQTPDAIDGLRAIISFAPAVVAALSFVFIAFYPLGKQRMHDINLRLAASRRR